MLRVLDLNANLGGAEGWVKLCADVADGAGEGFAGKGVESDVGVLADMNVSEIILVDVADDPDVGEVGDGERAGGACVGDAGGTGGGDVLRGDDAARGRVDLNVLAGMILVDAEDFELLFGGDEVGLGIVFAGLCGFLLGLRDGTLVEEQVVAIEGDGSEVLVVYGLEVGVEGDGDVGALNFHDELAFMDVIAETDVEGDNSAIGEGEHGNLARDIWIDRPGDLEFAADGVAGGLQEGETAGAVDMHDVRAADFFDLCGGGSFRGLGSRLMLATR